MPIVENTKLSNVYEGQEWKISSKALDMLQCFMSGLDDVIICLALKRARDRQQSEGAADLRVDARDIEAAANTVLDRIRSQGDLPEELRSELGVMDECLRAKCRQLLTS